MRYAYELTRAASGVSYSLSRYHRDQMFPSAERFVAEKFLTATRSSNSPLKLGQFIRDRIFTRGDFFRAGESRARDFDRSRIFRATLRSALDAPRLYLEQLWEPGRGDSYTTV